MAPVVAVVLAGVTMAIVAGALASAWPRAELGGALALEHAAERRLVDTPRWRALMRARLDPTRATGFALTVASALLIGGIAVAGILFAMVRAETGLERWDLRLARWGAEHATARSTDVLRWVTDLGGTGMTVAVASIVAVSVARRSRSLAAVWFMAMAMIGQNVLVNVIKWIVDRARPDIDRLVGFAGPSFPSGHAAAAATTYASVALLLGWHRSPRVRAVLSAGAAGLAAAVAATRVVLGVHWFTDVLAGMALGWAWFALCAIAFGGRLLRFGAPVEAAERAVAVGESDSSG